MARKKETEDFTFRPFRNLKKTIETENIGKVVKDTESILAPCPSDEELFKLEMSDVREITEFRRIHVGSKANITFPEKEDSDSEALKTLRAISKGKHPIRLADTQEYVEWVNPVYGNASVAKKLHEGRFAVQDYIDLHGFTVDEAEALVDRFIHESRLKALRCIRIIHGRGLKSAAGPVLKSALVGWLSGRFRKNVIAFATARQCDGGLGALYILLGRRPVKKK